MRYELREAIQRIIDGSLEEQMEDVHERNYEYIEEQREKMFNIILILNKMASIARMVGGEIINATAFVGGSYLARYLSGRSDNDEEKKRHDLAVEKYAAAYKKYEINIKKKKKNRTKLLRWISTNVRIKDEAKQNF